MDFQAQRENTMTVEKVSYNAKNRITGGWKSILMNHPLLHVVCVFLPAAQAIPTAVQAQVKAAPPISGVLGKLRSFTARQNDSMVLSFPTQSKPVTPTGAGSSA